MSTGLSVTPRVADAMRRIERTFLDAPETRLTNEQAMRVLDLDPLTCQLILDSLQDVGFLVRGPDGVFARRS